MNWIHGPARADLGDYAEIEVPPGFRFASSADAASVLKSMGNPVPETLVGLLSQVGGNFMVVFEYTPMGYVKTAGSEDIDPAAVLQALRENTAGKSGAAITSLDWQLKPRYDQSRRSLEWAVVAETGSRKSINHFVRLLGRKGVLDGIAVQPGDATIPVPLHQLMAGAAFKAGYRYSDYQKGDRVAQHGLADLIAGDAALAKAPFPYVWAVGGGSAAVALALCSWVLIRRKSKKAPVQKAWTHPNGNESLASAIRAVVLPEHASNGKSNGNGRINGNGNGKSHGMVKHRRRVFDYQRFYSDLMFQVSDQGNRPTVVPPRRNAPPVKAPVPVESATAVAAASASLLEMQKRLIEEQQRLIREQAKLIEEKTRLIQEKTQVLDKQVELFGNNLY